MTRTFLLIGDIGDDVYHVGDEATLLRRNPRIFQFGRDFHFSAPARHQAFLSPECPLKVRVGANSPSL